MTPNRPYLVRAIYEWIVDNGLTPHLLVKAEGDDVDVPREYVKDGRIVLSVAPRSVRSLELGNDFISFGARFSGRHFDVCVPVRCVLAVYARENGRGIALAEDEEAPADGPPKGPPKLRVVN